MPWHVIHTKPQAEAQVCRGLAEQGYGHLMPECWRERKRGRGRKVEFYAAPLFPRYVLVEVLPGQRIGPIFSRPGVAHVLSDAESRPAVVPEPVIADIRARLMHASGVIPLADGVPRKTFRPAQRVRIVDGPAAGLEGLYVASERDRIRVLLDMLGRKCEIVVREDIVSAAPDR